MLLLGEDLNLFRMVVWHCTNLIEEITRLIRTLYFLNIKLLKVALMGFQ